MQLESIIKTLEIKAEPESWHKYWEASQKEECKYFKALFDKDHLKIIDNYITLPDEVISSLKVISKHIQENKALGDLAKLWHYLLYHIGGKEDINIGTWQYPSDLLRSDAHLFGAFTLLSGIEHTIDHYKTHSIPFEIMKLTLSDINIWLNDFYRKNGYYGLDQLGWLRTSFIGSIHRIGRLQYCFKAFDEPIFVYQSTNDKNFKIVDYQLKYETDEWKKILGKGDTLLDVHIPADGKMDFNDCIQSFKDSVKFHQTYFPDKPFEGFVCTSWLLSPNLKDVLPADSNVVRFMKEFIQLPYDGTDDQMFERVFGMKIQDLTKLPQNTSLQKSIVAYLSNGGTLKKGRGFIPKSQFE